MKILIEEANQTEEARLFIPSDDEGYIRINCNNFKNISDLPLIETTGIIMDAWEICEYFREL